MNTIKSEKRFLEYHLTDTILKGEGTLQDWEIRLENQGFCSPYRGYLINIRHVQIIQAAYILMDNGSQKEEATNDRFLKYNQFSI